mmetsp:Transcript_116696/g.330694  ORF Transcript_116696/g.330694 Transcript_116696/m.330694 type:complete len:315 (-) Transcript_116696:565-1509(-)
MMLVLSWRHLVAFLSSASSFSSSSFRVSSSSYSTSSFMSAFFRSLSSLAFSFSMDATALLKVSTTCRMCSSSWILSCHRRACASWATLSPKGLDLSLFSCSSRARSVRRAIRLDAIAARPDTGTEDWAPAALAALAARLARLPPAPSRTRPPAGMEAAPPSPSDSSSPSPSSSSSSAASSADESPCSHSSSSEWSPPFPPAPLSWRPNALRSASVYSKRHSGNSGGALGSLSRRPTTQGVSVVSCPSISCSAARSRFTSEQTCCRNPRKASTRWLNSVLIACIDSSRRNICRRFFSAFMRWFSGTWYESLVFSM